TGSPRRARRCSSARAWCARTGAWSWCSTRCCRRSARTDSPTSTSRRSSSTTRAAGSAASAMTAKEWIDAYAAELGTDPPTAEEFKEILDLAAEAAHASERVAAPVACWLAAAAGRPLDEALQLARDIPPAGDGAT